jgi:hypothetical protein
VPQSIQEVAERSGVPLRTKTIAIGEQLSTLAGAHLHTGGAVFVVHRA